MSTPTPTTATTTATATATTGTTDTTFCSVLNVVIDHTMQDPSPIMEPQDYHGKKKVKVPVLRVFGPVLRTTEPVQSACLYIHGAFPYLLARPVLAGPDGSLQGHYFPSSSSSSSSSQVNWDDVASVERVVDAIANTLETSLQSLELGGGRDKGDKKPSTTSESPIVRNVTVVEGRGFYTYCPGPPAPFLRVEYYDPKLRWKVKLMLERGLDLPLSYHPNPELYDQPLDESQNNIDDDAVKFHCYEAHIPYTMQFFKDQNLAGMSYIHLSGGKLRGPLPERCLHGKYRGALGENDDDALFLRHNTPQLCQWKKPTSTTTTTTTTTTNIDKNKDSSTTTPPLQQSSSQESNSRAFLLEEEEKFPNFVPPKKETSCDVEIDCTVHHLRNVETVLKTLPSDQDERDKIQWRAVPSLQEIWRQERSRMRKLLQPQHDFLSHPDTTKKQPPPFTLNVKKDADRSGARLAAKGMHSLVQVTEGLADAFTRSLTQILQRHQLSIQHVDEQLLLKTRPRHQSNSNGKTLELTPTWTEAMDALESLAVGGEEDPGPSMNENGSSSQLMEWTQSSQSLSYSCSQELHESAVSTTKMDPVQYSQRVERGDGVVEGPGRDLEDYINPETLLPYEHLDFGGDRCRAKFVVETDPPETIRVCGGNLSNCFREGHDDAERVKPGYYKTVSTGAWVDGIIFESQTTLDEEEEEDNENFERILTTLATQIPTTRDSYREPTQNYRSTFTQSQHPDLAQEMNTEPSNHFASNSNESSSESSDDGCVQGLTPDTTFILRSTEEGSLANGEVIAPLEVHPPRSFPAVVTPRNRPPTRVEVSKLEPNSRLHLVENKSTPPTWLLHAARYMSSREIRPSDSRKDDFSIFSRSRVSGTHVQPVSVAPSRSKVMVWCKKREQVSSSKVKTSSKRKKLQHTIDKSRHNQAPKQALQIDSNSRKLVQIIDKIEPSDENQNSLQEHRVEEFQWEASQAWQMTMTQATQNESEEIKPNPVVPPVPELTQGEMTLSNSFVQKSGTGGRGSRESESLTHSASQNSENALEGIGAQGGRIHVQGGGGLKARTRPSQTGAATPEKNESGERPDIRTKIGFLPTPIAFMSIEIHVQCRTGASRLDSKKISMAPDSNKDKISAVVYVCGIDPSGGESLTVVSRGCIFVPLQTEKLEREVQVGMVKTSMPRAVLGIAAPLSVEAVKDEKSLMLRLASIVRMKDPDILLSWDTQGAGLGYLIERGGVLGSDGKSGTSSISESSGEATGVDMIRLLGRTPHDKRASHFLAKAPVLDKALESNLNLGQAIDGTEEKKWRGSGLGSDWDERVGAGAAAASIVGRLIFAGWKIIAEEVKHGNASYLPAVAAAVLNKRIPYHDDLVLTQWYANRKERWRVINHRLTQATACLLLFDALDIIGRAGEAARLSGVEFSQSFPGIRGSQYKVEGVLLRALQSLRSDERGSKKGKQNKETPTRYTSSSRNAAASSSLSDETKSPTQSPWKMRRGVLGAQGSRLESRHYFFFSPSLQDTNHQEALEVQALTLEPQSGHYQDPVVVCDFTALYPSLVIAYNLCYSTCAGRLEYHSTRKEMQIEGKTSGRVGAFIYPERRTATILTHHMKSIADGSSTKQPIDPEGPSDRAYVAPTGTIYVSEDVLKGVLPQVLDEILTTRAMLKRAAKEYKKHVKGLSPAILRQLEARQLALKYVANVTYGYTSATFSGRCAMPLLADTIVECGRKTLRRAIGMANRWGRESKKWVGCEVIYGDTDSLFIKLPGRSYKEAFEFGEELCRAVTADNPPPVQLKLEKVYVGSIMQTMKRYCGMKFESKNQKKPVFEAKGLETVRRDQCALTQKVLRNALIALFRDGIDAVKEYLYRQWALIFAGQLPVSDFILTGRVRSKYRGGREGPVQAVLARRIGEADPGRIVRHKERLPYVIVATPGVTFRLKDCVLTPMELLERWDAYTIHSAYYIEKHVNASLQRCLGLAPHHADINAWYQACPKPRRRIHFWPVRSRSRAMITSYFGSDVCSLCQHKCQASGSARVVVCEDCRKDRLRASQAALLILNRGEKMANAAAKECSRCNLCFESSDTFATVCDDEDSTKKSSFDLSKAPVRDSLQLPLANCVCIDCPNTFKRHRLREQLVEAVATCEVLGLL